jgi:hypothetical protein
MSKLLAEIALDAFLAARYCVGLGLPEGREWERAVNTVLYRPGLSRHQHAGLTTLFGAGSLSGSAHELDAAASGWRGCFLCECKALSSGIAKSDVATFHLKTLDFYLARLDTAVDEEWWPLLVSASPASEAVRGLCVATGIVLCDPIRFPLPVLLNAAAHPAADDVLPAVKLSELLRLAEAACGPMQRRWRIVDGEVRLRPSPWRRQDMLDLLWLQDELSGDLFDAYDRFAPGRIERRITSLCAQIAAAERAHV